MSDEDRDVDIESDEEDEDGGGFAGLGDEASPGTDGSGQFLTQAEKRAHHNALERKRRDHIKESFHSLRDSVPALQGEKVSAVSNPKSSYEEGNLKVSRAQILKKAADYIQYMRRKSNTHQQDIDDLKKQNTILEQQVRALEKAKSTGQFAAQTSSALNPKGTVMSAFDGGSGSESSEIEGPSPSRRKKMKTSS